jgi:hypothetical protein
MTGSGAATTCCPRGLFLQLKQFSANTRRYLKFYAQHFQARSQPAPAPAAPPLRARSGTTAVSVPSTWCNLFSPVARPQSPGLHAPRATTAAATQTQGWAAAHQTVDTGVEEGGETPLAGQARFWATTGLLPGTIKGISVVAHTYTHVPHHARINNPKQHSNIRWLNSSHAAQLGTKLALSWMHWQRCVCMCACVHVCMCVCCRCH